MMGEQLRGVPGFGRLLRREEAVLGRRDLEELSQSGARAAASPTHQTRAGLYASVDCALETPYCDVLDDRCIACRDDEGFQLRRPLPRRPLLSLKDM
jgi:hypothetical protein